MKVVLIGDSMRDFPSMICMMLFSATTSPGVFARMAVT